MSLQALEQQLKDQKSAIELRDMAIKLAKNTEFRKLILEGFCGTEAARYVQASGDPALNAVQRADALAIAQASGHFKRYMSVLLQMGQAAENQIADLEEAIEEARREEEIIIDPEETGAA